MSDIKQYIILDDLFKRYTVTLDLADKKTSVHCDECDEWVAEYDGEQITQHTRIELFEMIITAHDEYTHGTLVKFDNPSKPLSGWRE